MCLRHTMARASLKKVDTQGAPESVLIEIWLSDPNSPSKCTSKYEHCDTRFT